jgi:hypothetical protein
MLSAERSALPLTDIKGISERALEVGFQAPADYLEVSTRLCGLH